MIKSLLMAFAFTMFSMTMMNVTPALADHHEIMIKNQGQTMQPCEMDMQDGKMKPCEKCMEAKGKPCEKCAKMMHDKEMNMHQHEAGKPCKICEAKEMSDGVKRVRLDDGYDNKGSLTIVGRKGGISMMDNSVKTGGTANYND